MAVSRVHAVETSHLQSVCWSQDNRLAVSANKEILIMKLNTEANGSRDFSTGVSITLSLTELTDKYSIWKDMEETLKKTRRDVRSRFLRKWMFSSLAAEDEISISWTTVAWSPPGLAINNRTMLAALTDDHRIVIMGQLAKYSMWTQVADLGRQLLLQHEQDYRQQILALTSVNSRFSTMYSQMTSVAAVDLAWSTVFGVGPSQFALLFVAMKNADIVVFRLDMPCTGPESCHIVDRQKAGVEREVNSLVWTPLPDWENSGLLAIGYNSGEVEIQWWCWEADMCKGPQLRATKVLQHSRHLRALSLAWHHSEEIGLVLLCSKELVVSAYTCVAAFESSCVPQDEWVKVERREEREWQIQVIGTSDLQLIDVVASGLQNCGNRTLLSTDDGRLYTLMVSSYDTNPVVSLERKLPFNQEERDWNLTSFSLSPNATLCIALFRPAFAYSHVSDRFRYPVEIHISPVASVDTNSLEHLLCPQKVSWTGVCCNDVLQFAQHVLCQKAVSMADVTEIRQRLTESPYKDTLCGEMMARFLLSSLHCLCKKNGWGQEISELAATETNVVERLLCHQITFVWNAMRNKHHQNDLSHSDKQILNTMLNWLQAGQTRMEALGSEVMGQLTSAVGQSDPVLCCLCDSEINFTGAVSVTCANKHSFSICCHTLLMCNTVPYQCCSGCGALAVSVKKLEAVLGWRPDHSQCRLCGSCMYDTSTTLRL